MSEDRELSLRLHFDGEAVSGDLGTADGELRAFSGWLGLMSQLESLRPPAEASPPAAV